MDAIGVLFVVLFGVAIVVFAVALSRGAYRAQLEDLRRFEERSLRSSRMVAEDGWFPSLANTTLTGELNGRRVHVGFRVIGSGKNQQVFTLLELDVRNAVPPFKVEHAGFMKRLGRFFGFVEDVQVGNEGVDQKYILSGQRGSLRELFRAGELEHAIDGLFGRSRVRSLELDGDRLQAEIPGAITGPADLEKAFARLVAVAEQCERKQVVVKVLGEKPKLAITGGTGHALCPFCRDDVVLDAPDVMACEGCNTVHHSECYTEAGGCTIYGCNQQRVRA